ncbi:UNVERIFIED_CONTAM: hypothetical protein HDU68_010042 [Siphonaria sp. JEL0065]|nr:hypothetical protein HDU68_010042 [Siphonaria sp. JEL0065]
MVELEEMTEKQQMKTFMVGKENTAMRLYAAVTEEKMKVFLQVSRAKVFEVDLSKWEEEGSERPIFSITGEFKLGRFMIIGRDESRRQKNVGNSSGWVAARDGVSECNFEIEEEVFYDQYEMAEANMSGSILIRRSPLLMAGVVVALASKKSANSN